MTDYKAVKIIRNGCEYCFPNKWNLYDLDVIIVWGGWGGWGWIWWGWWWWEVIAKTITDICKSLNICIWQWWAWWDFVFDYNYRGYWCYGCWWCQTVLEWRKQYIARWWCGWSPSLYCNWTTCYCGIWWASWNWCSWWWVCYYVSDIIAWWGWWWAWGNWCCWMINSQYCWQWWLWLCWYWWGWGWGNFTNCLSCVGKWCNWWWNWWWSCCSLETPIYPTEWVNWWWGWWWGSFASSDLSRPHSRKWCKWWDWIVEIRYKTDWSCWISCATWWTVTTDWDYTVHKFTSDWTFCVVC